MTVPHASCAEHYDEAYRQSFGSAYASLTDTTLAFISTLVNPPARIVDFGAGTGRLALRLAEAGYEVVATEPCEEMLSVLKSKASAANLTIETVHSNMEDFASPTPFDLALCVFTVIAYITDHQSLNRSFKAAAAALRPGGFLLLDIPSRAVFQSHATVSPEFVRDVQIVAESSEMYRYEETGKVRKDGVWVTYHDQFRIRHWDEDEVLTAARGAGFEPRNDVSGRFATSGSNYLLLVSAQGEGAISE